MNLKVGDKVKILSHNNNLSGYSVSFSSSLLVLKKLLNKQKMNQYRQGDLLLTQIIALPKGLKKLSTLILLRGEATGHSHRLTSGSVFKRGDNLYLALEGDSQLVHEEHNTVDLPSGFYAVTRQREYTSENMTRLVVD